jgi:galactokinase
VTIESSLPGGAGLGSSAALEVATALALLAESGATVDRLKVAQWCQRAENEFVGARCGIMDQYVTCFGQPGHALLIDCRSLESRQLPLAPDVAIVVCNTMVKHALAASEYNTQRADCELAVDMLRQSLPHVQSLRDVTLDDLVTHRDTLPPTALMRARHVVSENLRVVHGGRSVWHTHDWRGIRGVHGLAGRAPYG